MERGFRYNEYAQLRELKFRAKRLGIYEIESISEVPILDCSPEMKKSVKFHGDFGEFEEDCQVLSTPKPDILKKTMKFQGISSNSNENVKKSVKFNGVSSDSEENVKKPVKFQGNLSKFEEDIRVSSTPKPDYLRKSVKFHGISSKYEENVKLFSPLVEKSVKIQGLKQGNVVSKKENRTPTPESTNRGRISRVEKSGTSPSSIGKREKVVESAMKSSSGNKSVNSGEKPSKMRMIMGRKSYASIEELKGLSIVASNSINGKKSNVLRKSTIFSTKCVTRRIHEDDRLKDLLSTILS